MSNHIDVPEPGDKIECCFGFRPGAKNMWTACTVVPGSDGFAINVEHADGRGCVATDSDCWRWPADKKPKRDVVKDLYNEILREKSETLFRELVRVRRELGLDEP